MDLDFHNRRTSNKTSRRRSSLVRSEEDSIEVFTGYRRGSFENTSRKPNLKTGLKVSKIMKEQQVNQRVSLRTGSARPSISRGKGDRHIHDARHFIGVIYAKIGELTEEIQKLHFVCKDAKQEYANSLTYEIKAKELAADIANFQTNLADLNLAFDYINSIGDIEKFELEAKELSKINNFEKDRNEALFGERKLKEDLVNELEVKELLHDKRNKSSLRETPERNENCYSLNDRLSQSLRAVEFWEKQNELYNEIRSSLIENFEKKFSPASEIIKFETVILDLKRKLKKLDIDSSPLKLAREKQKLLEKVKQDTADISKMEFNTNAINIKINSILQVIDSAQLSDHELKTIEGYLLNFNNSKEEEICKLKNLESEIINILSELQGILSFTITDLLNFQQHDLNIKAISDLVSVSGEHTKILDFLKKMEIMEFKIIKKCKNIDDNYDKLKKEYEEYKSQNKLVAYVQRRKELLKNISKLKEEEPKHLLELDEAKARLEKVQLELSENDKHKQIFYLEEKHSNIEQEIMLKKQGIKEMKNLADDLQKIKGETINLMEIFNMHLISNINGV